MHFYIHAVKERKTHMNDGLFISHPRRIVEERRENNIIIVARGVLVGIIVQELCESRGGRPGLSVLTSLLVSVDVKLY